MSAICGAYFLWIGHGLAVDDDEAFYVLAGRQLYAGHRLYQDFFFPQAPLSAIVYGLWDRLFGPGLVAGRTLSALLTTAIALLIWRAVRRRVGGASALLSVLFYAINVTAFRYLCLVKTFALSTLLLMCGLDFLTDRELGGRRRAMMGVLLGGLSVSARLTFAPVLMLLPWIALLRSESRRQRARACAHVLIGELLGLLPFAFFAFPSPERLWFCNVTYHGLRSRGPELIEDWDQKWQVLQHLIGLSAGHGPQFAILLGCGLAGLPALFRSDRPYVVYVLVMLSLGVVSVLPSPTWEQYFSVVVAPAAVAAGVVFGRAGPPGRALQVSLLALSLPAGLLFLRNDVALSRPMLRPDAEDSVARALQAVTRDDSVVASAWPGFLVASTRTVHPTSLNQVSRGDWSGMSDEQRHYLHVYLHREFERAVLERKITALVIGRYNTPALADTMIAQHWRSRTVGPAVIWTAP